MPTSPTDSSHALPGDSPDSTAAGLDSLSLTALLLARRAAAYRALLCTIDPSPRMGWVLSVIGGVTEAGVTRSRESHLADEAIAADAEYFRLRFEQETLFSSLRGLLTAQNDPETPEPASGARVDWDRLRAPFAAPDLDLWQRCPESGELRFFAPASADLPHDEDPEDEDQTGDRPLPCDSPFEGERPDCAELVAMPAAYVLSERLSGAAPDWSVRVLPLWESAGGPLRAGPAAEQYEPLAREGFVVELGIGGLVRSAPGRMGTGGLMSGRFAQHYEHALFEAAQLFGIGAGLGERSPLRLVAGARPLRQQALGELIARGSVLPS